MAFTFDAKNTLDATSTGLTLSLTANASAKLFVACVAIRGNQTINAATYGGVALSIAVEHGFASDYERTAILYLANPPTGTNNFVVTLSGSVEHFVSISSYLADGTPSLVTTASSSNNSGHPTLTTSTAGTLGVDCVSTEENANPMFSSAGADQTILHNVGSGSFGIASSYDLAPGASETWDWTFAAGPTSNTWAQVAAIFTDAGGGTAVSDSRNVRTTGQAVSSDTRNVRVTASAPATPQKLRPIADVSIGAWTTEAAGSTNLYQSIDETSANDADYIQSSQSPGSPDIYKVRLSPAGLPESGTSYVRWRYEKDNATASIDLTVRLCKSDGITEIDSEALPNITDSYVDGSFTWDASVLTAEELGEGLVLVFEALAS